MNAQFLPQGHNVLSEHFRPLPMVAPRAGGSEVVGAVEATTGDRHNVVYPSDGLEFGATEVAGMRIGLPSERCGADGQAGWMGARGGSTRDGLPLIGILAGPVGMSRLPRLTSGRRGSRIGGSQRGSPSGTFDPRLLWMGRHVGSVVRGASAGVGESPGRDTAHGLRPMFRRIGKLLGSYSFVVRDIPSSLVRPSSLRVSEWHREPPSTRSGREPMVEAPTPLPRIHCTAGRVG